MRMRGLEPPRGSQAVGDPLAEVFVTILGASVVRADLAGYRCEACEERNGDGYQTADCACGERTHDLLAVMFGRVMEVVGEHVPELPDPRGQFGDRQALCPGLDQIDQVRFVLSFERDRSRGAGTFECGDDGSEIVATARLVEELLARVPREREGLGPRGELHDDAVEAFRHCELLGAAGAFAGLDAHDMRESNELLLTAVDLDPTLLVRPAVAVDDGHDRVGIAALGLHSLGSAVDGPDPDGHRLESRP
jgi:hypothetical protein